MNTLSSLTAERYFWGHFDVLQETAGQVAQKGSVDYRTILSERVEHHLRIGLDQLPLHQSLRNAVKEWFYIAEFFSEDCNDWNSWDFPEWNFPEEGKLREKEYLLPVMHLCKLAVDAYDITSDGRLYRPDEDDMIRFTRFGCVPPNLLGATRYAMERELAWDGKDFAPTSESATQEFQVLIQRGLADAHSHLDSSTCFTDLFYAAIRGIVPPYLSGSDYLENGNTHDNYDFPFHKLALRPLLLACKAMFAALLHHAENRQGDFKNFFGNDSLSRKFWNSMYLAAKEPDSGFFNLFEILVRNILKKIGNYKRFFSKDITFEKNWFKIVRHVLQNKNDKELCYHFSQLTRCICCLYRPMFHREGSYEFNHSYRYIYYFIRAAGNPEGRPPRRVIKYHPLEKDGYVFKQNLCKNLKRLQLRISVSAKKKRLSCRPPRKMARKPLITKKGLEVELQNHLATYKKYIEEQLKKTCSLCGKAIIDGLWESKCPHCEATLPKGKPMTITFPIHFLRREQEDASKLQRNKFRFKSLWHQVELLASLFRENPALRYFFGRIDVASNEDLKPNWIFALMFQELEDRLKKITNLNSEMPIPRMRYNCHAGEHFASSIQGLRRIWEPVHHFPHLDGIGHAFALGVPGRFPAEMPADELLDDLVWVLLHREHIHGIPELERIERIGEGIVETIYGKEFDKIDGEDKSFRKSIGEILFRDLKDAYLWRFDRKKIAEHIGVLSRDKKTREYLYDPDFELPKDENGKRLPKAAKIMQKYFTQRKVEQPYKLTKELREILGKCYPFLRDFVKQEIIKKNIVVEVCPASNFRIGNLTKIEDHPLFVMCPPDDQKGGISVVFGSDDPAMFQTSIEDEYLFVKEAMDKKYLGLAQEKRLEYLETIRRRSMDLCCDDLPDDPVAILELIERAIS